MALLTLLTDFGYRDHYVAALKARLLHLDPAVQLLDISHAVEPFNIAHAVYVLGSVYADFPVGTVHLVGVSDLGQGFGAEPAWHGARFRDHFFVCADNGVLALLCDGRPDELVSLPAPADGRLASPTRDVLAPAAVRLLQGEPLSALGAPAPQLHELLNRQLRLQDNRITGHVVHVDHYGNLITNISRTAVEVVGRGRPPAIHFARETVRDILPHFAAAEPGGAVCTFNSRDCLCIGIGQGHAAELLGLYYDSQVDVRFAAD